MVRASQIAAVLPRRATQDRSESQSASRVDVSALATATFDANSSLEPLRAAREAFDRVYLEEALRRSHGNVSAAAKLAGRNRTDFYELLERYEIDPASYRP